MRHVKTDPVCIHYREGGLIRTWLNNRGRGRGCNKCLQTARWYGVRL